MAQEPIHYVDEVKRRKKVAQNEADGQICQNLKMCVWGQYPKNKSRIPNYTKILRFVSDCFIK